MKFLICIFVILVLISVIYSKQPSVRGKRGEKKVRRIIGGNVENEQYVLNDLILANRGKSSQIDHVVINSHGIFVIETKNYSGRIYGTESQREWTQVLAYGKVKTRLYNPLKQNATHVFNVKKIVGELPIHSLVVFVQNNTKYIDADGVVPLCALKTTLQSGARVLTAQQMKTAYRLLISKKSDITEEEHIRNVQELQRKLDDGICPRCGGNLVLRTGKYGKFFGCSRYPKCKFIKKC